MYGGHRGLTANRGGYRADLGQPPRHFARILHEGGRLHVEMAAVSNLGYCGNTYFPLFFLTLQPPSVQSYKPIAHGKVAKNGREQAEKPLPLNQPAPPRGGLAASPSLLRDGGEAPRKALAEKHLTRDGAD